MRNWRVDCVHSDRGSSWQSVTDGATAFRAESGEDAEWLCAVLNREAESVATSHPRWAKASASNPHTRGEMSGSEWAARQNSEPR